MKTLCMTMLMFLACANIAVAAEDMEAFLKTFAEKRASIHALKADFVQHTLLPDEALETPGTLLFVKPRRIVMRTDNPPLTTLIDDRKAYEYDPKIKQLNIFSLDNTPQAEIFFLGFENDLKGLSEAYDLGFFEAASQVVPTTGLSITPKKGDRAEAYFMEVRLYLDNEMLLPHKIHIINEDSEIITVIERFVINPEVKGSESQIVLSPGTFIIENDEMKETVGDAGKNVPEAISAPAGNTKTIDLAGGTDAIESAELPPASE